MYAQVERQAYAGAMASGQTISTTLDKPPPPPTRFSNAAGQLEARVAHLSGMVDRISRVGDRLGGSVPEEANAQKGSIKGAGNCVAGVLENSLDDLDQILARAERHIQRLEQL